MIKEYLNYLKDNPNKYWFRAKLYGWGWTPARWQGWCVIFLYLLLVLGLVSIREKAISGNPDSGSNFLTFALPIILLTALLIIVAYKKGEKPRWMWGVPEKYKQDASRYVCTGGCGGVSDVPGVCQATTCAKHGQPLTKYQ